MLWRVVIFLIIISLLVLGVFLFVANRSDYSRGEPAWGVTFSPSYAEELGYDHREVYLAMLDDLGVDHIRLPGYWDRVEKTPGNYDFSELDWLVEEASARDVKIILVLGQRQPRWPECHFPGWVKDLSKADREDQVLKFIEKVVRRYQENGSIVMWQLENEPLLNVFGECPHSDTDFLAQEIELVKSLDARPVMITESGELSTWVRIAGLADILGVSLYRVTYNRYLGYLYYPLTPSHYHNKMAYIQALVDKTICTELQAEPWATAAITAMSYEDMRDGMPLDTILTNMDFARRSGFPEIYLWGVEWWYYMKDKFGDDTYWNTMRENWK